MSSIKHIIFDFGNVLIDLDFHKAKRTFVQLMGLEPAYAVRKRLFAEGYGQQYERGQISETEFFQILRHLSGLPDLSDEELRAAWTSLLLDIPVQRLEMLRDLRKQYNILMLSNINHTHATAIHRYLLAEYGINETTWRAYFDYMYYSHEIHHRKPDLSAFQFVLDDAGLRPEECLFIDDLVENTQAAASLGIQTYTHNPKEDIAELIMDILQKNNRLLC